MSRRSISEASAVLDEAMGLLGCTDDCVETWAAGHGLTGMMVRSPQCSSPRAIHLSRKTEMDCTCLGPVTALDRMHAIVLLASMVMRPDGLPDEMPDKPVMGWNHVTTWTPHRTGIPLGRDTR